MRKVFKWSITLTEQMTLPSRGFLDVSYFSKHVFNARKHLNRNHTKRQIITYIQKQCLAISGKNIRHKIPYWQK